MLEVLLGLFPRAEIFTLVHVPGAVPAVEERPIHASWLSRLPAAGRVFPLGFPLFHQAMGRLELSGFDLVLSVSHCAAKNVLPPAGVPRLIGVHVRRGDACANRSRSAAAADPTGYAGTGVARKCDLPLEHYVALASASAGPNKNADLCPIEWMCSETDGALRFGFRCGWLARAKAMQARMFTY